MDHDVLTAHCESSSSSPERAAEEESQYAIETLGFPSEVIRTQTVILYMKSILTTVTNHNFYKVLEEILTRP